MLQKNPKCRLTLTLTKTYKVFSNSFNPLSIVLVSNFNAVHPSICRHKLDYVHPELCCLIKDCSQYKDQRQTAEKKGYLKFYSITVTIKWSYY